MTLLDLLPSLRAVMTPRVDPALWPYTTGVDEAGRMTVGGVALTDIADDVGTPACVIDEADFRYRARRYRKELPGTKVVYAGKALLTSTLAGWASDEHLGVHVCTATELTTAMAGGVDPVRIVFHGDPPSRDGLNAAVRAGVGRIVVESTIEIDHLADVALRPQNVLVRVTPQVESVLAGVVAEPMLRLVGMHCHIGSHVADPERYADATRRMIGALADVRRTHKLVLGELNIGGGHAVPVVVGEQELDLHRFATVVNDALDEACATERFPRPSLVVEPGRGLTARAAVTLHRVSSVTRACRRTVVAVDGDMRRATCTAAVVNRRPVGTPAPMGVQSGDGPVGEMNLPDDVTRGDLIAVACTGADVCDKTLVAVRDGRRFAVG